MFAEVRALRSGGARLSSENVRGARPRVGELTVFKRQDPWRRCWVPVASPVGDDLVTYLMPPLDQVRIARWEGFNLVLIGLEQHSLRSGEPHHLQAWWVRLVGDPGRRQTNPRAPGESAPMILRQSR